jgi:adenylosuccinate lyase
MQGLDVRLDAIQRNLQHYGPFAAVERVLMALGKAGADRQEMHERLRGHALTAWAAIQNEQVNPLLDLIEQDTEIRRYLAVEQVRALMDASQHIGDAPQRAKALAHSIRSAIL